MTRALVTKSDNMKSSDRGFTLIELLVVVVIIGILAAIAIPVYIGVQDNAKNSAAQSDLANAKIAVVAFYTSQNSFPAIDTATLGIYGYAGTSVSANTVGTPDITNFCLVATGSPATVLYYVNQNTAPATSKPSNCT